VIKHVEGETYDFKSLDKLPSQVIKVHKKNDTVADFEKAVSELFDIPVDKLMILIRHEHLYNNTVRSELYNMDWRRTKSIDEASRLDHG
jgi:alpha/beta superfamily hydrolase